MNAICTDILNNEHSEVEVGEGGHFLKQMWEALQCDMSIGLEGVTLVHMLFFLPFFLIFKKESIHFGEGRE